MRGEEIKIVGKMDEETREELKKGVVEELDEKYQKLLLRTKGLELVKNEEELRIIERINVWLEQYFQDANIEGFKEIGSENFVFLSDDDFIKLGRDVFNNDWSHFPAKFILPQNIIFINRSLESEKFVYVAGLLHETVHAVSEYRSRVFYKQKVDGGGYEDDSASARTGYATQIIKKEVGDENYQEYEYFEGLNEAIVQLTARDILAKHENELFSEFNITKEEKDKFRDGYEAYELIFVTIIRKVSKNLGISTRDYWLRFKKNLFTGNMMFLRDIEKTFGKGSLRVLAFLGSSSTHVYNEDMIRLFDKYFTSEDEDERNQVAEKIFSGEDNEKYLAKYKKRRDG